MSLVRGQRHEGGPDAGSRHSRNRNTLMTVNLQAKRNPLWQRTRKVYRLLDCLGGQKNVATTKRQLPARRWSCATPPHPKVASMNPMTVKAKYSS